jgi:hypothetical protein
VQSNGRPPLRQWADAIPLCLALMYVDEAVVVVVIVVVLIKLWHQDDTNSTVHYVHQKKVVGFAPSRYDLHQSIHRIVRIYRYICIYTYLLVIYFIYCSWTLLRQ